MSRFEIESVFKLINDPVMPVEVREVLRNYGEAPSIDVETGELWTAEDRIGWVFLHTTQPEKYGPLPLMVLPFRRQALERCYGCPYHGHNITGKDYCTANECPDKWMKFAADKSLNAFLAAISPFGSMMSIRQQKMWPTAYSEAENGNFNLIIETLRQFETDDMAEIAFGNGWWQIITPNSGTKITVTETTIFVNFNKGGSYQRAQQILEKFPKFAENALSFEQAWNAHENMFDKPQKPIWIDFDYDLELMKNMLIVENKYFGK